MNKQLDTFGAVAIVEGFDDVEHSDEELLAAWQFLIDSGAVWNLQGCYGRTARYLIEEGLCSVKGGE